MSSITQTLMLNTDIKKIVKIPVAVTASLKAGIVGYSDIAKINTISDADYQALGTVVELLPIDDEDTEDFLVERLKDNNAWNCEIKSDYAWHLVASRLSSTDLLFVLESIDAQVEGWKELTTDEVISELELDISHLTTEQQAEIVNHLLFESDLANVDEIDNDDGSKSYIILGELSEIDLDEQLQPLLDKYEDS